MHDDAEAPPIHHMQLSFNTPVDRSPYWLIKHDEKNGAPVLHLPGLSAEDSADAFLGEVRRACSSVVQGDQNVKYTVWQGLEVWRSTNALRLQGDALFRSVRQDIREMCQKHAPRDAAELLQIIDAADPQAAAQEAPEPGAPEPGAPEPGAPEPGAPEPEAADQEAPEPAKQDAHKAAEDDNNTGPSPSKRRRC